MVWPRCKQQDWRLSTGKTHASPGIGSDTQDVINQQLPEDYDIFLGVMWARFGTATPRAGSGTEEEFERALTRHHANPRGVRILFYFKRASLPPDAIDPAQLQKVQAFHGRLKREGILYGDFGSSDDFERLVRQHLTMQLHALLASSSSPDTKVDSDTSAGTQEERDLEEHAEEQEEVDGEELGSWTTWTEQKSSLMSRGRSQSGWRRQLLKSETKCGNVLKRLGMLQVTGNSFHGWRLERSLEKRPMT